MPGELRQTETGKWKIVNLKHDKAGITIPATFTYKGGGAKEIEITNSVQTVTTDWTTDVGVPISLSDVTRNYHDVVKKEGNVYKTYKAHDNFKSSDVHPITPTISLTTPLSEIESTATSISFTVTSNTKTKVECGSQRQPQSGSYEAGTNTGSFTISPNIDTTAKYYTIVAYCTGQPDISTSITVTQKAFAPGVGLSVTSPINADVTTLSYTATTTPTNDLAVLVKYGSLTKSDKIGTFTISPNTSLSPVNHVITAICRDYPAYTDTATVEQKAMAYTFEVNPTSFTFPAEGSTLSQQLTINNPQGYSWQITDLPQWLHASKVQGSDTSASIILRADANTGSGAAARSGSFTVKDVSNNKSTTVNVSQTAPALTPEVESFDISFEATEEKFGVPLIVKYDTSLGNLGEIRLFLSARTGESIHWRSASLRIELNSMTPTVTRTLLEGYVNPGDDLLFKVESLNSSEFSCGCAYQVNEPSSTGPGSSYAPYYDFSSMLETNVFIDSAGIAAKNKKIYVHICPSPPYSIPVVFTKSISLPENSFTITLSADTQRTYAMGLPTNVEEKAIGNNELTDDTVCYITTKNTSSSSTYKVGWEWTTHVPTQFAYNQLGPGQNGSWSGPAAISLRGGRKSKIYVDIQAPD